MTGAKKTPIDSKLAGAMRADLSHIERAITTTARELDHHRVMAVEAEAYLNFLTTIWFEIAGELGCESLPPKGAAKLGDKPTSKESRPATSRRASPGKGRKGETP